MLVVFRSILMSFPRFEGRIFDFWRGKNLDMGWFGLAVGTLEFHWIKSTGGVHVEKNQAPRQRRSAKERCYIKAMVAFMKSTCCMRYHEIFRNHSVSNMIPKWFSMWVLDMFIHFPSIVHVFLLDSHFLLPRHFWTPAWTRHLAISRGKWTPRASASNRSPFIPFSRRWAGLVIWCNLPQLLGNYLFYPFLGTVNSVGTVNIANHLAKLGKKRIRFRYECQI